MSAHEDDLGELLRAAIRESELSLNRIARQSGVEYSSLWRIANDNADPRLSTVSRLSTVLGLTLARTTKRRAK